MPECKHCIHLGDISECGECNVPQAPDSRYTAGAKKETHPTPSAIDFLETAAETMRERGRQYDKESGERSMGKAVAAFNIVTGRDLRESEGWLLLQLLKDVRDNTAKAPHVDSLVDCVAYSALKAEARLAGK